MCISTAYKELSCYENMNERHKKRFDCLASCYGKMLNHGAERRQIIYTLHDFDHHCFNIYRTISMFLLKDRKGLLEEELYLLNLAVLFHDISMSYGGFDQKTKKRTPFNRDRHSEQSAEWILHEFNNRSTCLFDSGDLSIPQVEIICSICKAHSDVKNGDIPPERNGLFDPELPASKKGRTGSIRVKLLAGLLRLADELDVTTLRLGDARTEEQFEDDNEDDNESRKHWRRLHLFEDIDVASDNFELLLLIVNDYELRERFDNGDAMNIKDDLESVSHKIQKELDACWSVLKNDPQNMGVIAIRKVKVVIRNEELRENIDALKQEKLPPAINIEKHSNEYVMPPNVSSIKDENEINEDFVSEIDEDISTDLRSYVLRNHLLTVGHFQLNDKYCARDWLDTESIAEDEELSKTITKTLAGAIKANTLCAADLDPVIIGLGLVGTRQAAEVAFFMERPFSYVIPTHQSQNYDTHEVRLPGVDIQRNIILITDCIVTGETIRRIIDDNGWKNVIAIYSIFWRQPRNISVESLKGFPVYTLCKGFRAEISYVNDCPFGKDSCEAPNRKRGGYANIL